MSGARINNYTPSTTTLDSVIGSVDYGFTGMLAVSLTNYTSTTRPAVSAGSIAEVASDVFQFSTEESISTVTVTSTAACDYYIKLVPSSSQCTAAFSTTAPTWRTDYQGYYQNSTSVERVIGITSFNGIDYENKQLYFAEGVMPSSYSFGFLQVAAPSPTGSTYSVPMDGYITEVLNIELGGVLKDKFHISAMTVLSTSVTLVVASASTSVSTATNFLGHICVSGR